MPLQTSAVQEQPLDPRDTGSAEGQIAVLSARIRQLTDHLKVHTHDYHSQRGLLCMVSKRRKLLRYLKRVGVTRYRNIVERLGLRS